MPGAKHWFVARKHRFLLLLLCRQCIHSRRQNLLYLQISARVQDVLLLLCRQCTVHQQRQKPRLQMRCQSARHAAALQAVYTALKETESRATDVLPLWKVPALAPLIPRQRKAVQAVSLIRKTTEELIAKCKEMVDAEEQVCSHASRPPSENDLVVIRKRSWIIRQTTDMYQLYFVVSHPNTSPAQDSTSSEADQESHRRAHEQVQGDYKR